MAESNDIWKEYEAKYGDIVARLGKRLRSPEHPGMVHVEFKAELSRLQVQTAEKLGKKRDDLLARFDPEMAKLKEMCGV